ncbi:MBG domain-containing protein [Geobacter sp. FeAm09]|uniref:MBG domain-containing protein n=1 Tax=Geobacter sp. FeAm09 TaxID=2597769 RepID=UPI00143DE02E|nr:MBG domain-containing protein [Geobacter sp. FeAm09]
MALCAVVVVTFMAGPSPAFSHNAGDIASVAVQQGGKTVADLPEAAQAAVSEAVGRDNAAYHATKIVGGYQLKSVKQELAAQFRADGAVVSGWRLSLCGIGRGDERQALPSASPEAKANRVEYRRGDVTEWYVNGPLGLEQGFTLSRAPESRGAGTLSLALQLPDKMQARVAENKTDVSMIGQGDASSLSYGKLAAWDATGKSLRAWFETGRSGLQIRVDDSGAQYPITIDPLVQQQELTASDPAVSDWFGASVALSGDGTTALIGAYNKNSAKGAAYVFAKSGGTWNQLQKLTASDAAASDQFGWSVSLSSDGTTALIGAVGKNSTKGVAYVFAKSGGTWGQQQILTASDALGNDRFGISVALSGDGITALIGACASRANSSSTSAYGAAYVFTRSGTTWSQQQKLTASDPATGDYFGWSVSMSRDGTTALIGANLKNSSMGAAYVFTKGETMWSQQQKLTASDAATSDQFGISVSLGGDGNTALVGARYKSSSSGAAYVFTKSETVWSQQQKLTASDSTAADQFGFSVSLSSDSSTILIGAYNKSSAAGASYAGSAYVFTKSGAAWSQQQKLAATDAAAYDNFGWSTALSGDGTGALVGARGKNSSAAGTPSAAGAAYAYQLSKTTVTITLGDLNATYDGTPKAATVTTDPAGLAVGITYNDSSTAPTNAGSYTVVATINDFNYQGTASGTLVINKAAATVTLSNLTATYDGTPKAVTVTTNPAGKAVIVTYNGSTTAPTNAGSYDVVATISDTNYQGTASGTLVIGKATAAITLSDLTATHDGTAKSATAITNPTGLAVTFTYTYNGSVVIPINVGTYTVVATISDANYQGTASGTFKIVDKTAPVLTISTLPDGSVTNNEMLNITGTVTDDVSVKWLKVNLVQIPVDSDGGFNLGAILDSGANTIKIVASDSAGNTSTDSRTITLDLTAPNLLIAAPADNSKTATALATVNGTVDENSSVAVKLGSEIINAAMNGTSYTAYVTLVPGINTIVVTATDLAGKTNALKRTVIYDDQSPNLAITIPSQDSRTNQANLTIRGTVSDPYTDVTVSIAMDGQTYTPAVVNGQFEQAVTFTTEKSYAIVVTATNEAGVSTSAQRNVVYDVTKPGLTIDPVTSPTSQASAVLTGTRETGTIVSLSADTAAVIGGVTYPDATTWSCPVSSLAAGANNITVSAQDQAGNTTSVTAQIVYQ